MPSFRVPGGPFASDVHVPGDKSLSHRSLILAGMARGDSRVTGLGPGRDVASTVGCLAALGVEVEGGVVHSPGVDNWREPARVLDAGNSATTLRLLAGALAGRPFPSTLVGDSSLARRPMERLAEALGALGARVGLAGGGHAPVRVGGGLLHGAGVRLPLPSAQVRTAVALAALQAEGTSTITSPPGFRDHTERWLESLGRARRDSAEACTVLPGPVPPGEYRIPGDLSSASFLLAAAALREGAAVTVRSVTLNPGRTGFLEILQAAGAEVTASVRGEEKGDPWGDVTVRGRSLRPIRVEALLSTRSLDELPLVALLGAAAVGETVVGGAAELRAKESDRAAAAVTLVRALGGAAEERPDGFVVRGDGSLEGGRADAAGDHRIGMAAAVAAVICRGPVSVTGWEAVAVSWPGFAEALESLWS